MNNVISFTQAAKAKGVGIIAYLNAERLGLGPNQCAAAMRRARELYESRRASPAKAVSLVRRESYELSTSGAA